MKKLEITEEILSLIRAALKEDGADRDVTSLSLVDPGATASAVIIPRHSCVVSGCAVGKAVFELLDPSLDVGIAMDDGSAAERDDVIMRITGKAASILTAERTALNFMQRMTGIATATREFVRAVSGTKCKVLDTRKTLPGFRVLDKYAVLCGGGTNHRMGLSDMALIKDNHRKLWKKGCEVRLDEAVNMARAKFPGVPVEVEVESMDELRSALSASPEWIMLDNMTPAKMKEAAAFVNGRCKLEASGGITMDSVRAVAETGVDALSLGCLTHSVKAADLSLELAID